MIDLNILLPMVIPGLADASPLHDFLHGLFLTSGLPEAYHASGCTLAMVAGLVVIGVSLLWLLSGPVSRIVSARVASSATETDDIFLSAGILRSLSVFICVFVVTRLLPLTMAHYPSASQGVEKICVLAMIAAVTWPLLLEINAFTVFMMRSDAKRGGMLVLRNVLNTIVFSVAVLLAVSTIMGRDIAYVVSFLGAAAAAIMFVFKDSILGMAAGIRLSVNKMVKVDDWVTVPRYNADGRIEDITFTAVKIRNWDESVSTVPPHALIAEGFVNRQAMLARGSRQIKRALNFDLNSVRVLTAEEQSAYSGSKWARGTDLSRPHVNMTLFRRYLLHRIESHPLLCSEPRYMVRELAPTEHGLPVEVYFFVNCLDWREFEELQADFFDSVIAAASSFGLELYQLPSGSDLRLRHAERVASEAVLVKR